MHISLIVIKALRLLVPISLVLSGCAPTAAQPIPTGSTPPLPLPAKTPRATVASPSPTKDPTLTVWLPAYLPAVMRSEMQLPAGYALATDAAHADVQVVLAQTNSLSTWIFVLAAPFPTLQDEMDLTAVKNLWLDGTPVKNGPDTLVVDPATRALFEQFLGSPSDRVISVPAERLVDEAWQRKTAWSILPFEQVEPRWKIITLQGQNPLHKDFAPARYPLTLTFGLQGSDPVVKKLLDQAGPDSDSPLLQSTNRRPDRLTTVVLTGTTALVRGTAAYMEQFGMDYPAQDIGPWLRDADILHISNEIAFAKNCPSPSNWQGLAFCSQERYIQLLEDIGTDVIDLAGDHFADWGQDAMNFTLALYRQRGWPVYGGGANTAEAKQPALFEHNGNKIAFLGCNAKEIGYSTVGPNAPGAIHCDPAWLLPAIRDAKARGYLPIVTFQHQEYYEYIARPQLQTDFRAAAAAGAVIVSGSQAHQPHALEFQQNSLLHYGLGNLFFDQVFSMDATRKAFIDRHVFYNGRYIGTELLTIYFVDYARARPMTTIERQDLLRTVFSASGWTLP
jgi:hypothetical protein